MKAKRVTGGVWGMVFLPVFFLVVLGVTLPARSITINLTFNVGVSDTPGFDPAGTLLQPIMEAAAGFWEDMIEDTWTIDVEYYYASLPGSTLALHTNLDGGPVAKPTTARVRFDTTLSGVERLWYLDPTPTDHSEFDLQQTLYRDLSGAQQAAWFNGAPPDLLEVGYRGGTNPGAPVAAVNGFDLFSSAVHEIGHAVGLTGNVTSPQTDDGDYDVNTLFVNGAVMGIVDSNNHIAPGVSLMCAGCGAVNRRRLPTATDVFAAAAAAGWTMIDLPRQDFLGGTDWGTAGSWEGGLVPDGGDDVFIRHGGAVSYGELGQQIRAVTVGAGSTVNHGGVLQVTGGPLTLGDVMGMGTYNLQNGLLNMSSQDILVDAGAFNFTGGTLRGAGVIDVGGTFVQAGGTLSPGESIGVTDVIGDYTFAGGALEIELGGIGGLLDMLNVTGDIGISILGTTLDLRALGGMPAGTYTVMQTSGGVVSGMFENVIGLELFGLMPTVQYGAASVSITLGSDLIFTDPNGDGFVGIEDLNIVLSGWNQNVTPGDILAGDLNGDGFVGIEDLNAVLGSWNLGAPPPPEVLGVVPEPSALGLVVCGTAVIIRGRRC